MIGEGIAFFNGLMASLSPCTFPMYPIIFAYFFVDKDIPDKKKLALFIGGYIMSMLLLAGLLLSLSGISMVSEVMKFAGAGFMIIFGAFLLFRKEISAHFSAAGKINNPFIFGALFAFMINPCSFPFLLSTLSLSIADPSGYLFIMLYGAGLIIPPTLFAILGKSVIDKVRKVYSKWWLINYFTGGFLIVAGIVTALGVSVSKESLLVSSGLLLAFVIGIMYFGFRGMRGRKGKTIKTVQMAVLAGFWAIFTFRCHELMYDAAGMTCSATCEICSTCVYLMSVLAIAAIATIYATEKKLFK